jgi:hypothetical protein
VAQEESACVKAVEAPWGKRADPAGSRGDEPVVQQRDEFPPSVIEALSKRAAFICSNPDCRALTIAPSGADDSKWIYAGKAAHICAAASGGPRYKDAMKVEERSAAANGIFLCSFCADMIDKNKGLDYPEEILRLWKADHDKWVAANLNKRQSSTPVEYQKRVTGRLARLSDDLFSEFNPTSEDYLKDHCGLQGALALIHNDFTLYKDEILAAGEWTGWVILPGDTLRFQRILEPVRTDPFVPDQIRSAVVELLERRLDAFSEISGELLTEYRNALASGEITPREDNWVAIMNRLNAEMAQRNCSPGQVRMRVDAIREMIQQYLSSCGSR